MDPILFAYTFMSMATAVAVVKEASWSDIIASTIVGITWPFFLTVKIIQRVIR